MSKLMSNLIEYGKRKEYFPITEMEKDQLRKEYLDNIAEVHKYLTGEGDLFMIPTQEVRYALFYLEYLTFNGCPFYVRNPTGVGSIKCEGDILNAHPNAETSRCIKCGSEVSDYRV